MTISRGFDSVEGMAPVAVVDVWEDILGGSRKVLVVGKAPEGFEGLALLAISDCDKTLENAVLV